MSIPTGAHSLRRSSFGWVFAGLVALFFMLPWLAHSDVEVEANASQRKVMVGEEFSYSIRIASKSERLYPNRTQIEVMPSFEGLRLIQSSPAFRQSIVNDQISISWTWRVMAEKEGQARITEGRVVYRGKAFPLSAIDIEVVKDPGDILPEDLKEAGILSAKSGNSAVDKELRGRLFAQLTFDKQKPYLKESIEAVCTVYFEGVSLNSVDYKAPEWEDFFVEEVDLGQLRVRETMIGDRRFKAVDVRKFILTPTKSGPIKIPMSQASCELVTRRRRSNILDDPFFDMGMPSMFDSTIPIRLPIATKEIEVQSLPDEGRPPSFQGAVGHFSFAASVDQKQLSEDDLLTLRLEVGGTGYMGSIEQPKLPEMEQWRVVGRQKKTQAAGKSESQDGKKVFEVLLRPENAGDHQVPEIRYAFFDPSQGRYVEQVAGPFQVQVSEGQNRELLVARNVSNSKTNSTRKEAAFYGEQMAYIHAALPEQAASVPFYRRAWYPILQLLPFLMVGAAAIWQRVQRYREQHADHIQRRSAGSRARKELRGANAALRKGDLDQFYVSLAQALREYVSLKTQRSTSGLTLDDIETAIQEQGADREAASSLRKMIERCDMARYSSMQADQQTAQQDIKKAGDLLKRIDKMVR
ncbi:MAG: BatD family protein [Candidatus Sumerlaeia bacterium]